MSESLEIRDSDFLKRRLDEEILKFGKNILQEVFSLFSTHYSLKREETETIIKYFFETIEEALPRVEVSNNFGLDGGVDIQAKDFEFWRQIVNFFKNKLSSIPGFDEKKINAFHYYFFEVSSRICCPVQEPPHIGEDRMP
jgi:hypothetical protein